VSKGKPKPIHRRTERQGRARLAVRILVTWVLNAIGLMIGAASAV
jgi:hypothetical protein